MEAATRQASPWPFGLEIHQDGYNKFLDPDGYPAVEPPWGTLNAINLDTGEIAWKIPFGEFPELVAKGMRNTGSENYGGPVVTAGGLLFIGATDHDRKFHAYDKATGKLLWETDAAGRRQRHARHLRGEWTPVRSDRGRRRQVGRAFGRKLRGVRAAQDYVPRNSPDCSHALLTFCAALRYLRRSAPTLSTSSTMSPSRIDAETPE